MMNYRRLRLARKAGRTLRAHTVPLMHRQTVGEHTYGVIHILMTIIDPRKPDHLELLRAAMFHDVTEAILGDVPATAKWKFHYLEEALKRAEDTICDDYQIPRLVPGSEGAKLLKFADYMELALFCIEEMRTGNTEVEIMAYNSFEALKSRGLLDVTPDAHELYEMARLDFERLCVDPDRRKQQ